MKATWRPQHMVPTAHGPHGTWSPWHTVPTAHGPHGTYPHQSEASSGENVISMWKRVYSLWGHQAEAVWPWRHLGLLEAKLA